MCKDLRIPSFGKLTMNLNSSEITDNCKTVKLQKPCLHLETEMIKLETAFLKRKFS